MFKEILFYILSLIFSKQEGTYLKEYMIDTKYVPQYIYWIDDINVLLSSYGYTEIFNTYSRKSNSIDTCSNCIYGYDRGFVYCKYENRDIFNINEFSTTVYQYDIENNLIFSKDISPTVIPFVCTKEYILFKTGDPVLEQSMYVLDIKKDVFKIYEKEIEKREWYSRDKNKKVVIDDYNILWLYKRKSNMKILSL